MFISSHIHIYMDRNIEIILRNLNTVFPRFNAPGRLPIFEDFGGALNRTGALTRAGTFIKTDENVDSPFPTHTRTLFIIYDN